MTFLIELDCTLRHVIFHLCYSNKGSGVYQISVGNNQHTSVYCRMSSISGCQGGGWTLVMKIDGRIVSLCDPPNFFLIDQQHFDYKTVIIGILKFDLFSH